MSKQYIYTSPDGGKTVYQNEFGKLEKTVISMPEEVKAQEQIEQENNMVGCPAIAIRRKHPGLQEAWDQYKTMWELAVTEEDLNADYDD